jgi:hypothetical protein
MARRAFVLMAAIAAATIGLAGSASACCKEKFVRTKPHVNVSASSGETVVIGGFMSGPVLPPKIEFRPGLSSGMPRAAGMRLAR